MNLAALMEDLARRGVQFWLEKDQLRYRAPKGALDSTMLKVLAENKANICAYITAGQQEDVVPLPFQIEPDHLHRFEPFPLSELQLAYWVGRGAALESGNGEDHIYLELDTPFLDIPRFEAALHSIIARHAMLRAVLLPDGQQQVLEKPTFPGVRVIDLRGQHPQMVEAWLEEIRRTMEHQWLSLERWPTFDLRVTLLDSQQARVHLSLETMFVDTASLSLLLHECIQYYIDPEIQLEPLECSFRDYILAVQEKRPQTERYQRSKAYWLQRLPNLPPDPVFPLMSSSRRPAHPRFFSRQGQLTAQEWSRFKARAALSGITPTAALLAAFAEILTAWNERTSFSIDLQMCHREAFHPQMYALVGNFASLSVVAIDHSKPEIFEKRAQCIQQELINNLEHRYYSAIHVHREAARMRGEKSNIVLPVLFRSALFQGNTDFCPLDDPWGYVACYSTQTLQALLDHQVYEIRGKLVFHWSALEGIFPPYFVEAMFDIYCRFLHYLSSAEGGWQSVSYPFLLQTQAEQRAAINRTERLLSEGLLHMLVFKQVEQRPQSVAIIAPSRQLTYLQIQWGAVQIARWLREQGLVPDQLVGVVMEKGWEQVVAVYGILWAGAAYVPIDPELPEERRLHLLENAEVTHILTQSQVQQQCAWIQRYHYFCVDALDLNAAEIPRLEILPSPHDLACVMYTSDASGLPKGVMLHHQGIVNTVLDINHRFAIGDTDKIFALSDLDVEQSLYDIFGILAAGGTLVLPPKEGVSDNMLWFDWLIEHQVTIWNSTPDVLQWLINCRETVSPCWKQVCLRIALLSGSEISPSLLDRARTCLPDMQLICLNGALEASLWTTVSPAIAPDASREILPYGVPLNNQRVYVLNELLEPCPVEVPGHIYVGGVGLARGYWRSEAKTRECFLSSHRIGERLYKTGERGCYLPDGTIGYRGRTDLQIRINGHRVELDEIENTLMRHPEVELAVVTAVSDLSRSTPHLIAYVTLSSGKDIPERHVRLRQFVEEKLPRYMVPSDILVVEGLFLAPYGQIDRQNLYFPEEIRADLGNRTTH